MRLLFLCSNVGEDEDRKPYKYDCLDSENVKPVNEIELKTVGLNAPSASLKMTAKLSGAVDSLEEKYATPKDHDRLGKRTHANHLKFNKAKYKVLHVGWGNPPYQYRLGAEWIESIPEEKDLGYRQMKYST
ncbi:hypothetical protein DUI87_20639 [Hirundo rustica rustica]|uniref:Uncharacterized protein n=1 Tax=Hirundo rustica rustica TaxID=333673 RepID=A0A3M0JQZ2_HIRRU|nr:hypothetical protein DUI87_20639 [Hirundo rustica rustica]